MSFREYYAHYLTLHQNVWNRRLHVLGQIATVVFIGYVLAKGAWLFLLMAPLVVYPFAWSGHFIFEKNTPAAFSRPLWAKACDWIMLKDMAIGNLER